MANDVLRGEDKIEADRLMCTRKQLESEMSEALSNWVNMAIQETEFKERICAIVGAPDPDDAENSGWSKETLEKAKMNREANKRRLRVARRMAQTNAAETVLRALLEILEDEN